MQQCRPTAQEAAGMSVPHTPADYSQAAAKGLPFSREAAFLPSSEQSSYPVAIKQRVPSPMPPVPGATARGPTCVAVSLVHNTVTGLFKCT